MGGRKPEHPARRVAGSQTCDSDSGADSVSALILYCRTIFMSYVPLLYVCMLARSNHCIFFFSVPALQADPNTLFRSNSLSSKAMEQFMKVSKIISFAETEFFFSCLFDK